VAGSHVDAATVLSRQGEKAEALAELNKARDIVEELAAKSPDDAQLRVHLQALDAEIAKLNGTETASP
jgi:hypothetical protein